MIHLALETALRSAVLITLVWAALALVRVRNPHRLKALWTSVVLASLSLPLLMQMQTHLIPAVAAPLLEWTVRTGGGGAALTDAPRLRVVGILVYVLPGLLLLWRYGFACGRLWRIRREGRPLGGPWTDDGLDVRVSAEIPSPATFGRTILLPEECSTWSRPKFAAVMAHERAHVLHRDCYALWLARLHACIFWFNPLAWWIVRRLAALSEQTSDEAAVAALGNGIDYAEILVGLRMGRASTLAAAMASSDLPRRVERILSGVTLSPALRWSQVAALAAAILPAVALAAAPVQSAAASSANGAQSATGVQASAGAAPSSTEPRVLSWPPLEPYYPREALHKGVDGMVDLAITLDREGRATDTQILTEYPLDMGFGAAASALAHAMTYSNPSGQPVTFTVRVAFKLADVSGNHPESASASASASAGEP